MKLLLSGSFKKNLGMTLAELMVAVLFIMVALVGVLVGYIRCMEWNEMSRASETALILSKNRMEAIEDTAFNQIAGTYNNVTFSQGGFNGIGVTYVEDAGAKLLRVTSSFSWAQKNGRVIGGDRNLNGRYDVGESATNGILDSPVQLKALFFDRD
ncbi:MAG: hypothetical protein HQL23_07615 [Candidatus Omnitrophica bacterium]|nr:hypothetical protein [Candidatus Omnitrophota bacterium]